MSKKIGVGALGSRGIALLFVGVVGLVAIPSSGSNELGRVSVSSAGAEGNGKSLHADVSADGMVVVFESDATNLVPGDTNGLTDVFVIDRPSGTTTRVSVDPAGAQANGPSTLPAISGDGRFVAFQSQASNLVPNDVNGVQDVFLFDRLSGALTLESIEPGGQPSQAASWAPSLSGDGRFISFHNGSWNMPSDANPLYDAFVRDRLAGETRIVSIDSNGLQTYGANYEPTLSSDGRFVAFYGGASLVPEDTNPLYDVYLHDRLEGTTKLVSANSRGQVGNSESFVPVVSDDGRYVAFHSQASNLVDDDINSSYDVFVRDMRTGFTTLASVHADGLQATGPSLFPSISGDGRYVAFASAAADLESSEEGFDANATYDVFVHDRVTGRTTLVSRSVHDVAGNGLSFGAALSRATLTLTFESTSSNLIAGDSNKAQDVFVGEFNAGPENVPPVIEPIADRLASIGGELRIDVTATDPNGTVPLAFSSADLPLGAQLDPVSGRFSWTPMPGQSGVWPVTFVVTDPLGLTTQASLSITVRSTDESLQCAVQTCD